MAALSNHDIELLVDLVEDKLVVMSSDGRERCGEYQSLQVCRHALLIMAANANEARDPTPIGPDRKTAASHLRSIPGGKS